MSNRTINTLSGSLAPVNAQLEKLQQNINDKLDRIPDSGQMNALESTLDANSNRIINLPEPSGQTDPLRLKDLNDFLATNGAVGEFNAVQMGVNNQGLPASEAINSAISTIALGGGGILFFPAGTYLIDSQISLRSTVSLRGSNAGSVLKATEGLNQHVIYGLNSQNLVIDQIHIDGSGSSQTFGTGITIHDAEHVDIRNCRVFNTYSSCITLSENPDGCDSCSIIGNVCEDNLNSYSVVVDRSKNFRISNNLIINPAESGIQVFLSDNGSVTGNVVEHTGTHDAGFGGIRITATSGLNSAISVVGNVVRGTSRGVFLGDNTSDVSVTGNTIENVGRDGIFLGSGGSNNVISSNSIRNPSNEIANTWAGVNVSGCNNNLITSNRITDTNPTPNMKYAIDTGGSAENNVVSSNYFTDGQTGDCLSSPRNYYSNNFNLDQRDSIASASTLNIPFGGSIFSITGTATIDNIQTGTDGRDITLLFGSTATVKDGTGNLRLNGDFVAANQGTITFKYLAAGSTWQELSRSPN